MRMLLCLLLAWVGAAAWAQPTVTVVTSIHPYAALVQEIAGQDATVVQLLPSGASPHTFDPTPQDVVKVADADLVVFNGVLDGWLTDLVASSGTDAPMLEVMTELDFKPVAGDDETSEKALKGVNPHIWLDPVLMKQAVPLIVDQLVNIDPEHATDYQANGKKVVEELGTLTNELQKMLAPLKGAAFVPFHDAWPYFARRFGLNLVVEIEPAPGREPSPAYIADALSLIKGSGAKAIFSEPELPKRPAEVVAESAGLPLYILDPLGGGEETQSYADLMRYNAHTLVTALGNTAQ